jgi:hypothetical protein
MHRARRRWASGLVVGAAITLLGIGAALREVRADDGQDVTVQGEVVDMACYMSRGSRGAAHKAWAQLCAKTGVPIGILTDAGELYLLLDDHNNPDPYEAAKKLAGDRAEVSGKRYSKPGVTGIVVGAVKGL